MTVDPAIIISAVGASIAVGGVIAGYGAMRSSTRSAHYRITEVANDLTTLKTDFAASLITVERRLNTRIDEQSIRFAEMSEKIDRTEIRLHKQIEEGQARFNIHERESTEIRERLTRIETLLERLTSR